MTLLELFALLKKHLRLVIALPVVCALVCAVVSYGFLPNTYTATTSMYVLAKTGDGTSSEEFKVKDSFTSNLFRHLVFGLDFTPSERFYIALGYNYKTRTDMSTYSRSFLSGFSLGAGLNLDRFSLGLAFAQPHSGATTLMVNLNLNLQDILN